jgi:predicted MPP superfamily phosphohydrolase
MDKTSKMKNSVKFSAFADLHHYPGVFKTDAPERLRQIQQKAQKENVDFIVQLGDFCHIPQKHGNIIAQYNDFSIPSYHVLGNHDTDGTSYKNVISLYQMPDNCYYFDKKGFRFVVLDTNFYRHHGGYTHFEFRNYFDFPETREFIPPEQIEWLRQTLMSSPFPCVLLSHSGFEREANGVRNQEIIRSIINEANSTCRKVVLCINGHHHRDFLRIIDNVAYFDLNSASFDWLHNSHTFFPNEYYQNYELAGHMVIYKDPIHAVITLHSDGWLNIDGMKSSMLLDITREMTNNDRCDPAGRVATPNILSTRIKLW